MKNDTLKVIKFDTSKSNFTKILAIDVANMIDELYSQTLCEGHSLYPINSVKVVPAGPPISLISEKIAHFMNAEAKAENFYRDFGSLILSVEVKKEDDDGDRVIVHIRMNKNEDGTPRCNLFMSFVYGHTDLHNDASKFIRALKELSDYRQKFTVALEIDVGSVPRVERVTPDTKIGDILELIYEDFDKNTDSCSLIIKGIKK